MKTSIIAFVLSAITTLFAAPKDPWVVKEEFLSYDWKSFDCHGSFIVETAPGCFCAVWKGGPGEGKSNIDIKKNVGVWSALFDGKHWSQPKEIITAAESVAWTPVLFKYSEKDLHLYYRIGSTPRWSTSFVKHSSDGGKSWSEEEVLPGGIVGPTRGKPLLLADGTILYPSSTEAFFSQQPLKASSACWIERVKEGKWAKVGPIAIPGRPFGALEPVIVTDSQGNLKLFCRDLIGKTAGKGSIWTATSSDDGLTWSDLKATTLPNPNSGIDVVDLGKGNLIMLYNHSNTNRFPLTLARSTDGGESWSEPVILEKHSGEFPSAILASDGLLHITYSFAPEGQKQRRTKHMVIDLKKLP